MYFVLSMIYLIGCIATLDVARRDMIYGHSIGAITLGWSLTIHAFGSTFAMFTWPISLPLYILIAQPFGKLE